jgi:hypothetical protein
MSPGPVLYRSKPYSKITGGGGRAIRRRIHPRVIDRCSTPYSETQMASEKMCVLQHILRNQQRTTEDPGLHMTDVGPIRPTPPRKAQFVVHWESLARHVGYGWVIRGHTLCDLDIQQSPESWKGGNIIQLNYRWGKPCPPELCKPLTFTLPVMRRKDRNG